MHIHYETTGPEIWRGCGGKVGVFVSGMGTGETVIGARRFLRKKNLDIKVFFCVYWELFIRGHSPQEAS